MSALSVSVLFYGILGVSASPFGQAIGQNYLDNVTRPAALTFACSSIIVSYLCAMPLMTNPILLALLPIFKVKSKRGIVIFKLAFTAISVVVSIFFQDYLAVVSALTGTTLTMSTVVLLPVCIYVKLVNNISTAEKVLLVFLMASGIAFAIVGTYIAATQLLEGSGRRLISA